MVAQYEPDDYSLDDYSLDDFRHDVTKGARGANFLSWLPGCLPGVEVPTVEEKDVRRLSGIIDAMTREERNHPTNVIDDSRCQRIAAGAGVLASDVRELVSQFRELRKVMKRIKGMRRK